MLVQIALTLTVLLGFCGLALDVGMLELKKLQLQNAADAAALGASYSIGNTSAAWDAAKADATLNGFTDGQNGVIVAQPAMPTTGVYANNSSALQVTVQQAVNPIFFPGTKTITAQAVALAGSTAACSYLLSTKSTAQASIVNNSGQVSGTCNVYLGLGYNFNQGSSSGPQYLVAGSNVGSVSGGTVTPAAKANQGSMQDPFSSIAPPPIGACNYTSNYSVPNNTTVPGNQRFCGGLTINNDSSVTLSSGNYIIQGPLTISASTVTGSHVLFYMQPQSDGTCGAIQISGSGHVLSAPVSGPQQGILFYSDRSCPVQTSSATSGAELYFNSANGSGGTFDGILYLPGQQVLAKTSTLKGSAYFGIVADWFNMNQGTLTFSSNYSSLANGTAFPANAATLVQ